MPAYESDEVGEPRDPQGRFGSDPHLELPVDPDLDLERPLHAQPRAVALVAAGGAVGACLRFGVAEALTAKPHGFPVATFLTNLAGAFILGALLELLGRLGVDRGGRRAARLLAGIGVLGAFTTYSTLAIEVTLLGRDGQVGTAALYAVVSAAAGFVAAALGIAVAAFGHRRSRLRTTQPVRP